MTSYKELELDVSGQFSSDPQSNKKLSVSTTINGVPLSATYQLPSGSTGMQSKSFSFDLSDIDGTAVPKFTDNAIFPVVAGQSENGNACTGTPVNGIVLLPVVLIPGILNGQGGDGTYASLETYLKSSINVPGSGYVGSPYALRSYPNPDVPCGSLRTNDEAYPTLYTLNYDTDQDSFSDGATALDICIANARALTWADNVNLIGHSKGGLVGRRYLENLSTPLVHQFIMAETPNEGALKAAWQQIIGEWLQDLLPMWPWIRGSKRQQFTVDPPNPELAQLNNDGTLPTNVDYTILYSTYTNRTQITKTGLFFNYAPGDTVVPEFSQLARLYDPNNPSDNCAWSPEECPWVPAFVGVDGSVTECQVNEPHHGYFDKPDVQAVLLQRLLGGTCSEYSRNAVSAGQRYPRMESTVDPEPKRRLPPRSVDEGCDGPCEWIDDPRDVFSPHMLK